VLLEGRERAQRPPNKKSGVVKAAFLGSKTDSKSVENPYYSS